MYKRAFSDTREHCEVLKEEKLHLGDFFRIVFDITDQVQQFLKAPFPKRTTRGFNAGEDQGVGTYGPLKHTPVMILQFLFLPWSRILRWLSAPGVANRDEACSCVVPSMLRAPPSPDTRRSEEGNSRRDMRNLHPRSTASFNRRRLQVHRGPERKRGLLRPRAAGRTFRGKVRVKLRHGLFSSALQLAF